MAAPIQRAELKIKKLERLYDEQYVLIENYKDLAFGSKQLGIKILFKHKEEYSQKLNVICLNVEKFIFECESITNKIAGKNVAHISIGIEKTNLKKYRNTVIETIGYDKWNIFRNNKTLSRNKTMKCFEQDIWNVLKIKHFPGIDEAILEQKLEFVFSADKMLEFLNSNGVTIKNFVFFKHPTPCQEKMESRRRKTEVQETEGTVSNPYKTAEKTKDKTKAVVDDSSDSDITPKKAKDGQKRKELKKKDKKDKQLKREAELREKERSEKIDREKKRKERLQRVKEVAKMNKTVLTDSSSDENAIRPKSEIDELKEVETLVDNDESINLEVDSDLELPVSLKSKKGSKTKHQKKTKPSGIMDSSSDEDANRTPKKTSLPPKTQPNLGSSSSEDLIPMHAKKIIDKSNVPDKMPSIKDISLVVPEKQKKNKKKIKDKNDGDKKKKNKSSLVFSTDSDLDDAEPIKKKPKTDKKTKEVEKMSRPVTPRIKPPSSPGKYTCYCCFEQFKISPKSGPFRHKNMFVEYATACCARCLEFISDEAWTLGEDQKSDYCVISGEGGDIISCDTPSCKNSFTLDALRSWMGAEAVDHLEENEEEEFKCFSCDKELGYFKKFLRKTDEWLRQLEDFKLRLEKFKKSETGCAKDVLKVEMGEKIKEIEKVKAIGDLERGGKNIDVLVVIPVQKVIVSGAETVDTTVGKITDEKVETAVEIAENLVERSVVNLVAGNTESSAENLTDLQPDSPSKNETSSQVKPSENLNLEVNDPKADSKGGSSSEESTAPFETKQE